MLSRKAQMAPACVLSCATVPSATMPDLQRTTPVLVPQATESQRNLNNSVAHAWLARAGDTETPLGSLSWDDIGGDSDKRM